jgi:dihydroflavonol-4-reductase
MRVLVTGATGFIGFHVARTLIKKGIEVRALVRDGHALADLDELGVQMVTGDIRNYESICRAIEGCDQVYHLAADYRLWVPDPDTMYDINVQGTKNIMEAALKYGVGKVVYTSTVGVMTPGSNGSPVNEESPSDVKTMAGHYKKSKFLAEKEVYQYAGKGLPVIIVNPSTPVGDMDRKPTPTGKIIVDFLSGKMPAYLDTGLNIVDVEDVATGHLLAAEHGRVGQRYILGNRNVSLKEFLHTLARLTGKTPPNIRLPYLPVLFAACVNEVMSKLVSHRPPRIPLTGVRMARNHMYFDCSKAVNELHMPQSPIEGAVEKAVSWFTEKGYVEN